MCLWWCSALLARPLLLLFLLPHALLATTTTAGVVEQGRTAVFKQLVEVLVEGAVTFTGTAVVEASRYNADTLIILTTRDSDHAAASLVSGHEPGRAVVVKSVGGRVTSLLHHIEETAASLNYKRALASLLTPAQHNHDFAYHTQADVLGTCEVHYEHDGSRTWTWRDLTRCSHFSWEQVLGGHHLPLLHLALDLMDSSSRCEYRWRGEAGGTLEGVQCTETLLVAPRYTSASQVLNISITTSLSHTDTSAFNPAALDYLQEATETTALTYETVPYDEEGEDVDVSELLKEVCSTEGEGRLTAGLLQKMSQLIHALARTTTELPPDLTSTCPVNVRRMVALSSAVVGGPRSLHFFVSQLVELSRDPEDPIKLGEDYLFNLALRSLVRPDHHTRHRLPQDFFDRRENQMVYEELVDFLLQQTSPAVAGVAAMLEGLKEVSPQLFVRLLEKSGPHLSPKDACLHGDHAEAVRLLRGVSGLGVRPEGYVTSLRPCFKNDNVDVVVAAMDNLATANCDVEGATELQKLGLDSASDPEIRIASYRSLVHCIPQRPHLLDTVAKALDPKDDAFSTQVASYVWSHVQSVVSSDDPSMMTLRELLAAAEVVSEVPDPVWYDPRQHSRHLSRTVHVDARTALTLSADLVWGRYSPAPRALYLNLALHHDGATHQVAQMVVRVTGLEAMLLSVPGMESLLTTSTTVAAQLWSSVSNLAHGSDRSKREITQEQVAEFIEQVMSRIPVGYRAGTSSLEVSLRLLDTHAFHVRLADLRYGSPLDALVRHLQSPLQATFLALAPLLDNTLTMATSSGVPVALELSGVGGFQAMAKHYIRDDVGFLNFVASGGVSVWTRVMVGHRRPPALASQVLWSLDVPVSASYEYEDSKTRVSVQVPEDWTGRLLQLRRDVTLNGNTLQLRVTQDCLGSGGPMELCLDTWGRDETREGTVGEPDGWLAPYAYSLNLQMSFSGEPVITIVSTPNGEVQMTQVVVQAGDLTYEGNLATQLLPSPSIAVTLNSPEHSYFLKGFAGSRESITQVAGLEMGLDRARYGLRLQLSTPQLERQRVWNPSVFLTMPDRGEEEVVKLFVSVRDEDYGVSTEFSFRTYGAAAEYVDLRIDGEVMGGVSSEDGSLRMIEVRSLRVTWRGRIDVDTIGQIYIARPPQGQGSIKVGWGEEEGEVQLSVAFGPVVTFVPGPQHDPGGAGGTYFKVAVSAVHNNTLGLSEGSLALLLDAGRVDVSLSFGLSETGGFKFSHTYNGPLDFKTSASVVYLPLDIAWGAEHELVVREDELRHGLNVSWSARPQDTVSTLLHYVRNSDAHLDVSLRALLAYPGRLVEVEHTVTEARGGSYKSKLMVRLDPGRTLNMDTIFITRSDQEAISYGISNTVRLDSWITPLSVVGTVNCLGLGQCSVMVAADIAGDQLMDVELQHTAAGGVSRTDVKIIITDWVDGRISLDSAYKVGYYDLKWRASLWAWDRLVQGRAEVDLTAADVAATEMVIQELLEEGQLGALTHIYNGTVTLNHDARTLHVRQEVRVSQEGGNQLWAAVVQGRAGQTILNSRHFAKATLMTPTGMYYTASGDVSSEVSESKSVVAAVSVTGGAGPNATYLFAWNLDFKQPHSNDNLTALSVGDVVEGEPMLMNLETLLRANTPTTGEVKLNIKVKTTLQTSLDGEEDASTISEKTDVDIRLITEAVPELGRVHGSLTTAVDTYSLNGRMWSGQRSVGVVSYGVARNESLKSAHSVVLVDPIMPRGMLEVAFETDHVGSFPHNFQSSASGKVSVGLEEAGQVRGLLQWTPSTAAISLALNTFFKTLPGGNIFFKFSPGTLLGQVAWDQVKGAAGVQWKEGGRALELTLNLDYPWADLHDLDVSLTYSLSQMPYPPISLLLAARVSVNAIHHYVLNIDCRSQEEHYLLTGAMARPDATGSLRLQLRRGGDTYGAIGAIVFNGFSLQLTSAFTAVEVGEDLMVTLHSSLVPDPQGYIFRLTRKTGAKTMEIIFLFTQGGVSPEWLYSYRLLAQLERDIKQRVRHLAAEDRLVFRILDQLIFEYNFLVLVVHNNFGEMELEVKFPDLWPEVKMSGTLLKGKDSQLDLDITTPSITHILEGRVIFSSTDWWSAHTASLAYNQQDKGGLSSPFKLEMEASRWNTDRQKYKFFVQKTHIEEPSAIGTMDTVYEYPFEMYDYSEYSHDEPERLPSFTTFDATLDVSRESGSTEYKLAWQTDNTKNEANVQLEKDPSGGGALLKYHRQVKGVPKSEIEYQLKGNYRRIDTELTISCTLDQTSIERPRAIIFLHSEAEGYTELLLDLFQDEADQVILVITCLPSKFSFRIGQYTNTFLLTGYQTVTDDDGATLHKVEVGSFGRILEVWVGRLEEDVRTCTKGGLVLETPSLAPTHNLIMFCPSPASELTIQALGVEKYEGPYLRVGQISGPGGVGLQVGSGRLRPLDTPPAQTLTADVDNEVLEILLDWQSPSLAQLKEELISRGTSVAAAVQGLGSTVMRVDGALGLWPLLEDTQTLLQEATDLAASTSKQMFLAMVDDSFLDIGNLLNVSGETLKGNVDILLERCATAVEDVLEGVQGSAEDAMMAVDDFVRDVAEDVTHVYDAVEGQVTEVVDIVTGALRRTVRSPLLRLHAALHALTYNDDQSLYALVSRLMREVRTRVGRRRGVSGYLRSQLLTRVERMLVTGARWDELRARGTHLLQYVRKITTFSVVMPHRTALKLRVATPRRLGKDLQEAGRWLVEEEGPRVLTEARGYLDKYWSRVQYLLTWHVYGEAVVFGWDQAITWDGRQVTPLLTDSCPHLLVMLTHAPTPTAVTIHMEDLNTRPREVFTFFSGTDIVTLDLDLKMIYNSKHIRRPLLEVGELSLRLTRERASVTSAAGLSVECEVENAFCRLTVSGQHFAATAGLLGLFDFDNNTDFMTSGWEMPPTEEEWAQSWRVASSGQCSSQLPETHIPAPEGQHCANLFHTPESPFESCFVSVPPSPYLETCRAGWECAAEAAYLHACHRHYHALNPNITSCTMCTLEGYEEDGTEGLIQEVVIITDFECFADIQDLVSALVKDHNGNHRIVVRFIGRGSTRSGPFADVDETVVDNGTPPLDAALNAANLDFSARALKSIVLFDCDHPRCSISSSAPKIVKLRETLLTQGIQLHVITMDTITVLDRQSLTKKAMRQLIGLDGRTAFLMSHARKRKVKGKRNIRDHITTPIGNTCTQLAIESDGSVFSLQNIRLYRRYHRRIFQQLLALRVEEGREAEYLGCRTCECQAPCTLCNPPPPLVYTSWDRYDDEEDDEDYD